MKHEKVYCNLHVLAMFRRYQTLFVNLVALTDSKGNSFHLSYRDINSILDNCGISEPTLNKYLREMTKIGLLRRHHKSDSYVVHPYYAFKGKRFLIDRVMAENNFLNMAAVEKLYKKLMDGYDESRLLHKAKQSNKKRNAKLVKIN